MGNDGGSIPKRRELVKSAARLPTVSELKATVLEALTHAWQTDPLSGDPLDLDNVVSDWRGRLYNYETILKVLMPGADNLGRSGAADLEDAAGIVGGGDVTFAATGIRSLRDVVRLQGTPLEALSTAAPSSSGQPRRWKCPVSLKELGPTAKAVYLVPCGHVFSEASVQTFLPDKLCPECSAAFVPEMGLVPILPSDKAELAKLQLRIETLQADGLTHSLKKDRSSDKKKRNKREKRKAGMGGVGDDAAGEMGDKQQQIKRRQTGEVAFDGAEGKDQAVRTASRETQRPNAAASTTEEQVLKAKALSDQTATHKQRKLGTAR